MPMTALLVHGSPARYNELRNRLEEGGLHVAEADSGFRALALAELDRPGLVIVEDELPDMSGVELCQRLAKLCNAPTLLVGDGQDGRREVIPDEAIPAPVSLHELAARAARLLSSRHYDEPAAVREGRILVLGDISLNLQTNTVCMAGREIDLPPTQVNLLRALVERSPRVLSPAALTNRVWPRGDRDESYLTETIMRLRIAIEEDPADPQRVIHVPDYGYKLTVRRGATPPQRVSRN